MIYIIYGDDRVRAEREMRRILGAEYEVFDGAEILANDLPQIFMGMSIFAEKRKVLIKNLGENKENFDKLVEYLKTPHEVVIWEEKIDKRSAAYKEIAKTVKFLEFKLPEKVDRNLAFNVYDAAMRDGARAVKMLEKAEAEQDPYMMLGAFVWKAIDNYKKFGGKKEERVLKELSQIDMQMKSTSLESWTLLKSFLLRASSL